MSIINQTLRALDARQPGRAATPAPRRLRTLAKPRRAGLWILLAILLPAAGLTVWFISPPAVRNLTQPPRPASRQAALPHAATPVPPNTRPAPPRALLASPAVKEAAVAVPAMADTRRGAADPDAGVTPQAPARPPRLSAAPVTVSSPGSVVMPPPAIRKEVNQAIDGNKAEEGYRKALTLIQTHQEGQARTLLGAVLETSPGHVAAREALAALLSEAGQNQEAEKVLRIGRATNPEHAGFAFSLGRLQAARGDTEGAVATLQGGMEGRSVSAEYHATLAALLVRLKHYPDAVRQYEQALKLQSDQGLWWMGLGLSLEAQGRNDEARSTFRRALMTGNLTDKLAEFARAKLAE